MLRILPAQDIGIQAKRFALVIGNAAYRNVVTLRNPIADAKAVGEHLQGLGFEVFSAHDLDRRGMNETIERFLRRVEPGSEVLLYYAGHGVELQGSNYLLPVDIPALGTDQERLLRSESVNLNELLEEIEARSARVSVVIIDACRDNPFPKTDGTRSLGTTRGLGQISPPRGTFVIYAAAAGEKALDSLGPHDTNPNGVFTRMLLSKLDQEGLELRTLVRQLRNEVREAALTSSGHSQMPSYYDGMLGDFYFRPKGAEAPSAQTLCEREVDPQASRETIATADLDKAILDCTKAIEVLPNDGRLRVLLLAAQEQLSYRRAINSDDRGLNESYLVVFPNGRFADDVRRHLASIAAPAPSGPAPAPTPTPKPPEITVDPKDLARMVQIELKRVGCDPGAPDGVWGPASQRALATFNKYGRADYATAAPTLEMLKDLQKRSARICPLVCRQGFRLSGDTCVPIVCPAGEVANAAGVCVEAPPPAPQAQPTPAPATTQPSAAEPSLAGIWNMRSDCPLSHPVDLVLTATGNEQYGVRGPEGISGWVSGKLAHFEAQVFVNHIVWDGTVDSPTTMSGKVRPSLMLGGTCAWWAQKR